MSNSLIDNLGELVGLLKLKVAHPHAGRPGKRGGSAPKGTVASAKPTDPIQAPYGNYGPPYPKGTAAERDEAAHVARLRECKSGVWNKKLGMETYCGRKGHRTNLC